MGFLKLESSLSAHSPDIDDFPDKQKHTADTNFVRDYFPMFAHVQKALPVDKINQISHFVSNYQKCFWIYIR